jgi:Ca2+-binding RTX toxin-like protein
MNRTSAALVAVAAFALPILPAVAGSSAAQGRVPEACHGRVATIVGTPQPDHLTGTAGADVIVGLGGDDVVASGDGDDLICSGAGNDRIDGGPGADRFFTGSGHNTIRGGTGNDRMCACGAGHNVVHAGAGDDVVGYFSDNDDVYGGPGDDFLTGAIRPGSGQVLDDGSGANELYLDVLRSPSGASWSHVLVDLARGLVDADGVVSRFSVSLGGLHLGTSDSARSWTINGTDGPDSVIAPSFHYLGSVVEHGGAGDDYLYGAGGDDSLYGGSGDDGLVAYAGDDTLHGGPGDDSLKSYGGDDTLYGGSGVDDGRAGRDIDTCFAVEATHNCETSTPKVVRPR